MKTMASLSRGNAVVRRLIIDNNKTTASLVAAPSVSSKTFASPISSKTFISPVSSKTFASPVSSKTFTSSAAASTAKPQSDSTDVVLNLPRKPVVFRTAKTDPAAFDAHDVGLFHTLPMNKFKQLFQWGIEARFRNQINAIQEPAFMVRRPFLEIRDLIAAADFAQPARRIVVYGKLGAGKTMTLNSMLHYAAMKGWIIVQVPWALSWFHRMTEGKTEISTWNPRRIDLPYIGADWLRNFKVQNAIPLATRDDLRTAKTYKWTARESTPAGSHWSDIIDFGLDRVRYSSDCIGALLREIRGFNDHSSKPVRTLVSVDGVNMFYMQTTLSRSDQGPKVFVPAETVSLVHNFKKMLSSDWRGGAVVASVDAARLDQVWTMNRMTQPYDENCVNPREILGEEAFAALDPFYPVQVPYYDKREFLSAWQYYVDKKIIQLPSALGDQGIKEIEFLTNKNPGYLCDLTRVL